MAHHHRCVRCQAQKVPCDGTWTRNEDGIPEVLCDAYHLPNGAINEGCLCDGCRRQQDEADGD